MRGGPGQQARLRLVLLLALAVPFQVILVPLYQFFVSLHLVDSLNGLIVLYSTGSIFCLFPYSGVYVGLYPGNSLNRRASTCAGQLVDLLAHRRPRLSGRFW